MAVVAAACPVPHDEPTDPRFRGGTVWSPDGSLLASLDSRGAWVFVDRNGNRTNQVPVDNEFPFDWGS